MLRTAHEAPAGEDRGLCYREACALRREGRGRGPCESRKGDRAPDDRRALHRDDRDPRRRRVHEEVPQARRQARSFLQDRCKEHHRLGDLQHPRSVEGFRIKVNRTSDNHRPGVR